MFRYIKQAWLVLLLTIFFGGALAGVQVGLSPLIEANKKNEILRKAPQFVLKYDQVAQARDLSVEPDKGLVTVTLSDGVQKKFKVNGPRQLDMIGGGSFLVYQILDGAGKETGYVARISGQGYADVIEILLGFDADGQILTGVSVLSQKETPGLGNKIEKRKFTTQFDGIPWRNLLKDAATGATSMSKMVVTVSKAKGGADSKLGRVDAISGATVSSKAVINIVNKCITSFAMSYGKLDFNNAVEKK